MPKPKQGHLAANVARLSVWGAQPQNKEAELKAQRRPQQQGHITDKTLAASVGRTYVGKQ